MSSIKISPEGTNAGTEDFHQKIFSKLLPRETDFLRCEFAKICALLPRIATTPLVMKATTFMQHFVYLRNCCLVCWKSACCSSSLLCFMMPKSLKCYSSHQLVLKRGSDNTRNVLELLAIWIVQVR